MTHTKLLKVLRFKKHSLNLGDLIHERQSLIKFIAAAVSLRFDILRHLALHSTNCNRHTFNQQLLVRVFFYISSICQYISLHCNLGNEEKSAQHLSIQSILYKLCSAQAKLQRTFTAPFVEHSQQKSSRSNFVWA